MPEFKTANQSKIITGDSLEYLKKMPDKSVDLIVTSPPYNVGKEDVWKTN